MGRTLGRRARRAVRFPSLTAMAMIGATTVGVLAYGTGQLPRTHALLLMITGPVVAISLLRPGWVVLGVLVVPPGVLAVVPNSMLALLAFVPLVAMGLRDWDIDLRPRTGVYPLVGIVLLATFHPTAELGGGLSFADGLLRLVSYYAAMCLLAYTATLRGDVSVEQALTALLLGVGVSSLLELGTSSSPGQGPGSLLTYGRSLGNLVAMALSVIAARMLRPEHFRGLRTHRGWNSLLATLFLSVAALTLLRAAWMAIALIAVVAIWRSGYAPWLVILPLVAALLLTIPVARERVVPAAAGGEIDLTEYTTGRWRLWSLAASEIDPTAPLGRGWGTWWSFSPEELFDSSVAFVTREDQEFVFPHNDGLLLLIELGIAGLTLLAVFWAHLLAVFRRLLRHPSGRVRSVALALMGAPVMFFITQMVGNGLALRGVAERFFIVAGVVFALGVRTTDGQELDPV